MNAFNQPSRPVDKRLVQWGIAGVVLLFVSLLLQSSLLALTTYVVLGTAILCRVMSRYWAAHFRAERQCNQYTAEVGDRVTVLLRVTNTGRWPIPWAILEDILPARAVHRRPPRLVVTGRYLTATSIGPGKSVSAVYQVECKQRGFYQLGPLIVEVGDPLGLDRRYRIVTAPHFLLVYPQVVVLEDWDITTRRPVGEVRLSHRLYEDPTRIAGIRDYQRGDPLNRIHWRATARTGTLQCKLYEPSVIAGATLLLDFHRASYPASQEPYRSELAVQAAASLAHALFHMGEQVGLITNAHDAVDLARREGWDPDPKNRLVARRAAEMAEDNDRLAPIVIPNRKGAEPFSRILEMLARVELADGLPFPQLVQETIEHIPQDAAAVVLLSHFDEEHLVAVEILRRRGIPVTLIVNNYDDEVFGRAWAFLDKSGTDVRFLKTAGELSSLCRQFVLR